MTQLVSPAPRLDSTPALGDICDRCGVAAKLQVELDVGGALTFCGHHANEHAKEIVRRAAGLVVEDGFDWRGFAHREW
ncbi:MAG TPA: hypothetical protein VJT31_22535 [Rugosimonospora sp.]|nr:hypothetical protein [Rugosimonospora sp.]